MVDPQKYFSFTPPPVQDDQPLGSRISERLVWHLTTALLILGSLVIAGVVVWAVAGWSAGL